MFVTVNNRFGTLLASKRASEKRNIPITEVARVTGIARITLQGWANNTVTRFDAPVINALCRYFSIKPGDLFEFIDDNPPPVPQP
ncbi:MAG: helix-turn-helix transcriptional regulator [Chloroflexi bacterium]|nr:helix-turn-helix transcriptional regulator [Chloroflexota bacterium]